MVYDVIIVGGGPAGIFTAYELVKECEDLRIITLEKEGDIPTRKCPKHTIGEIRRKSIVANLKLVP